MQLLHLKSTCYLGGNGGWSVPDTKERKNECLLCNETLQYSQSDLSIINQLYALLQNQLLLFFGFWLVQMPVYSDIVVTGKSSKTDVSSSQALY